MRQRPPFKHLDTITALFVAGLVMSNLMSSAKLVDLGPLTFDGGLLIFPICYILDDILTEVYGFRRSRKVIWLGFLACTLLAAGVAMLGKLPGDELWRHNNGDASYQYILNGLASGGIVLASLTAYLVGEFTNSLVVAKMKVRQNGRHLWMRLLGSSLIGHALDTAIFFTITTFIGLFPGTLFLGLFIVNYVVKLACEIILLPATTRLIVYLKASEGEDYYDTHTSFNPLPWANQYGKS